MHAIRTLFTTASFCTNAVLPEPLRAIYDGDLCFPAAPEARPYVVANFVTTLDGVVSFNLPGQSEGSQISGANEGDHFIMGLLRASADAILMGSGTVEAVRPEVLWFPESIYPPAADLYRRYRKEVLKKPEHPAIVVVSGSGTLDLNRAVYQNRSARVLVITSEKGRERVAHRTSGPLDGIGAKVQPSTGERIAASAILELVKDELGAGLVLHEGGPTLFGSFLADGCIDELFLTIAPQIAGRINEHSRPNLVSRAEFFPATAPWMSLLTAKKAGDHLYLRYQTKNKGLIGAAHRISDLNG